MRLTTVSSTATTALCVLFTMYLSAYHVTASVFLPYRDAGRSAPALLHHDSASKIPGNSQQRRDFRLALQKKRYVSSGATAMAIPGYGVAEQVFVGGFGNFLTAYNAVITLRVLLSWFPQAQGIAILEPVFAVTDPYLNLFRGLIPPLFGLDLSPILAFFLLNVLTNATAAVGCEIPPHMQGQMEKKSVFALKTKQNPVARLLQSRRKNTGDVSMNY